MNIMDSFDEREKFFLGSGGDLPGISSFYPNTMNPVVEIQAALTHSTYAVSFELESGKIAGGTRNGFIYIQEIRDEKKLNTKSSLLSVLNHAASILSIAWLDKKHLSVADISANCIILSLSDTVKFMQLPTAGNPVCSLLKVDEEKLVGLDIKGHLLIWEYKGGSLLEVVPLHEPPEKYSLVNLVHIPSQMTLAYPGKNGELVLFDLLTLKHIKFSAHQGEFYALFTADELLFSIGRNDCLLKTWDPGRDSPIKSYPVPQNITSAAGIGKDPYFVIIINETGAAEAYTITKDDLKHSGSVYGKCYRTVIGETRSGATQNTNEVLKKKVRVILAELNKFLEQDQSQDAEKCFAQITELGFEHLSLGVKAEHELARGRILAGLECYNRIIKLIKTENPDSYRIISNYAILLEKMWLLDQAEKIFKHLHGLKKNITNTQIVSYSEINLPDNSSLSQNRIINPDISILDIIKASDIVEKTLKGRFLLKKFQEIPIPQLQIRRNEFAEKYHALSKQFLAEKNFNANTETAFIRSKEGYRESQIFNIIPTSDKNPGRLTLAIDFYPTDHGCILYPMLLLDSRNSDSESDPRTYNTGLAKLLSSNNLRIVEINLTPAYELIKKTVSRLVNEKMSNLEVVVCT